MDDVGSPATDRPDAPVPEMDAAVTKPASTPVDEIDWPEAETNWPTTDEAATASFNQSQQPKKVAPKLDEDNNWPDDEDTNWPD